MGRTKEIAEVDIIINNDLQRKKIQEMTADFDALHRKKVEAMKAGNGELAKSIGKEMSVIKKELNQMQKQTVDVDHVLRNLNKVPLSQLQEASRKLRSDIQGLDRDSVKYMETRLKLDKVESEIAAGRSKRSGMSKGWAIAGGAAALAMFERHASRAVEAYARLDDKMADVMKTTDMTKDEVVGLDKELLKIDTRTSREELLDLARVAGKLGIAKQDVEGFVRAGDQIKVALSEDLGGNAEAAIQSVGKLVDIFHLKGDLGLENAMLSTASAINSLGASSTANEGYMVEFANRMAGIAPKANISIQSVLGLGATLDSIGQPAQVASTAVSQAITGMARNTEKYAKVAGMSLKEFKDLYVKDANEAFLRFLEGLNKGRRWHDRHDGQARLPGTEGQTKHSGTGLVAVDVRVSGWPAEKGQRFEFAERQPEDDLFYFENALGGIDLIRFTGEKTLKRKYSSATAQQDDITADYDNDVGVSYVKNSGYLDTALEKEFAADFLRSDNRYHITGKRIKRVILLETESKTQDVALNEFEFEYRYQREDVFAMLRTFSALPVSIGASLAISQDNDIYRLNLEIEKLKRELEELEERMEKGDSDLKAKIEEIKTTITLINDAVISKTLTYSSSKIESMFQLFANTFPLRRSGLNVKWKELGEKFVDDWGIQDSQIFPIMVCGGVIEPASKGGGIRIRYGVKWFSVSHPLNNYRTMITHNLGSKNYFFVGVPEMTGVAYGRCVVANEISDNYIVVAKLVSSTASSENDADFPFHFAIFATDDYRVY